ncbi:Dbl homology domain-containing protein [Syncephalis plumigaleata]|nr:Dbl homology domain-containing protein [Syncephalis plumigaleata]
MIYTQIFLMPLSAITWITGEQKRAVIRNAWVIRGYHTTFLQQLESVIADIIDRLSLIPASNTNPSSVVQSPDNVGGTEKGLPTLPEHVTLGRIFLDHSNDFRSYVEYCSGHDKTLRVLVQLAENTKWRAFNEACKERLHSQKQETRLTIHDYLIKPVQRLCQYPIIMREIMSFYEEGTREHRDLRNAIDMLRNVATSVDDAKHMEEARQRTQLFLSRVDEISLSAFPDIAHYRNDGLLLAGALEFIDFNRGSKVCIKYYGCFVFPGLLLVARAQRAKTYRILHRFPLTDMLLIELSAAQSLLRYPWRLQCMKTKRNFDFGAAGPQERKLWFDLLARYTTQLRLRHRNDSTSSFESMASDLGLEQQSHLTDRYRNDTSGELYSGASDASLVETSSSRQSRSSAKSEDSTTSNTTLVPRIIRPNGLSRRYSHGNHDLHNAPTRKYTDVLSPVNEKSPDPPSPDQSLVRRILPLRRTQSVEFRSLHGSLTLPVEVAHYARPTCPVRHLLFVRNGRSVHRPARTRHRHVG